MHNGIRALRTPRTALPALLGAGLVLLLLGAPAPAQAVSWQCRGSVLSASVAGNTPSEPLVANSGFGPCVDASAGPQNVGATLGLPGNVVSAVTASASTAITPNGGGTAAQTVDAAARVENLSIALGAGAVNLGVRVAIARAVGGCASGFPALAGASEVAGLTVNGTELPLGQAVAQVNALLAPLGQVVDLKLGEQSRAGATLTQRALHLRVLGGGTALLDVVAGEARTGADGGVCSASGSDGDDGAAGGGTTPATAVCPNGSTLDAPTGRCVIRETTASGAVAGTIVVGRPFEGPVGGTVMSLTEARKRYRSVCLRGRGARFVVLGTARNDRVTGTNRDDRMLLLGGRDRGDGGRGDDCVDGGAGRDVLSGSQDRDRVYGAAGHDSLNGGPAEDRLLGGAGNDTINAAYGADATFGGAGRDSINIATAGPRASASCGAGRDTVRLNGSERRRLRGCERRLVLPDR